MVIVMFIVLLLFFFFLVFFFSFAGAWGPTAAWHGVMRAGQIGHCRVKL